MRTVSAPLAAAFSAGTAVIVTLLRLDFPSGSIFLNSSTWDFTWDGNVYKGAFGLGSISAVPDQPGELQGLQLELQNVDAAHLALALDDADEVQGSLVTLSTAILDNTTYQILGVELDWVGYADKMVIGEDGETGTVGLTAESKGVDLLRGNPLVYNDPDQQALFPGDRAFEYVVAQADQPVVWPSREAQMR